MSESKSVSMSSTNASNTSTTTPAISTTAADAETSIAPTASAATASASGVTSAPGSEAGDAADAEFEPTPEMLMDEFDDERTIAEAEAEADGEDQEEEISELEKEQHIPIEELRAMYRTGAGAMVTEDNAEECEDGMNDADEAMETEDSNAPEIEEVTEIITKVNAQPNTPKRGDNMSSSRTQPSLSQPQSTSTPTSEQRLAATASASSSSSEGGGGPSAGGGGGGGRGVERRGRRSQSDLLQLYPELEANGDHPGQQRALRSAAGQQSDDDDDEDGGGDGEGESGEEGETEEYRKTIMIGSAYQAQVPEGLQAYGATPPYENQDKLLWAPHLVSVEEVEKYLYTVNQPSPGAVGVHALPLGLHIRDDEQALHLLLQCGGNVEEARRRHNMNRAPIASTMTLWSEEECRNFENGLKNYGKDFHMIQQNKVRTRSVGELVQFYYLWKKTERHDMFAAKTRLEKKKFIVHPGTTDYMDRFLDEGESLLTANNNNNNSNTNNNNSNQNSSPPPPPPPPPPPSSGEGGGDPAIDGGDPDDSHHYSYMGLIDDYIAGNNNNTGTSGFSCNSTIMNSSSSAVVDKYRSGAAAGAANGADLASTTNSASRSSYGGNGNSSKRKRDYTIPVQTPSQTALMNQKRWKENQKPSVEMHALLYGRLPAGYKAKVVKDVSAAVANKHNYSSSTNHLHPEFGGAMGSGSESNQIVGAQEVVQKMEMDDYDKDSESFGGEGGDTSSLFEENSSVVSVSNDTTRDASPDLSEHNSDVITTTPDPKENSQLSADNSAPPSQESVSKAHQPVSPSTEPKVLAVGSPKPGTGGGSVTPGRSPASVGARGSSKTPTRIDVIAQTLSREKALAAKSGLENENSSSKSPQTQDKSRSGSTSANINNSNGINKKRPVL